MPKKRTPEIEVLSPVSDGAASAPSVARTTKTTRARTAAATHKSTAPKRAVKRAARVNEMAGSVAEYTEPVAATPAAVSEEEIARLAYSYWEARGYTGGSPEEDWYRAERELRLQIRG